MTGTDTHPEQDPAEGSRSIVEKQLRKEQGGEGQNRKAEPASDKSGSKTKTPSEARKKGSSLD
ncbi:MULTISPECIES: hypothetical protein [unclassified Mesorhizobium]|uniref:hypothetical protein n=1 Tax=unclassified Mesorhizobium TaxID=325217 RepID=UPI0033373240